MRLGDYADGAWMFVATCGTCGRQARVDPAEVLTHPRTHSHMRVVELALRLRCRDCHHRTARIDPVARLPKQVPKPVCRRHDLRLWCMAPDPHVGGHRQPAGPVAAAGA